MDLNDLKRLAGITEFKGYVEYNPVDPYGGSNISLTGNEKGELMKKHNIKPGTSEWFRLWFTLPGLTNTSPLDSKFRKD